MKECLNPKFREELIQQIKDVGQELINRADEFICEGDMVTSSLNIYIYFNCDGASLPTISVNRETYCTTTRDRYLKPVKEE